jgi:hypothetical protein
MKSKQFWDKLLQVSVLLITLIALTACNKAGQIEEEASTLEADLLMTVQAESSPAAPEPTAEELTEEPTREADTIVEPTPSEEPAAMTTELEEYVSVTDFFSLKIPSGWSSEETFPGGAFVMANSEAALGRYQSRSAVEPGDYVLNVGFLPFSLFKQREVVPLNIQLGGPPDAFLRSAMPLFNVDDDAVLSEVELISTDGERDAGLMTVSAEGRQGMILTFTAGDGVVALISTAGYPGELADFQDLTYAIASEVTFSGAEDVLYGAFLTTSS